YAFGYEFPERAALALFDLFHGFGFDPDAPFQHYLGRWKGHPVATCSMFFGAGVAGMHTTVVPTYRGQGIGAAMTLAPMLDAREAGYRVGVSNVESNGSRVQGRLGFKPYCRLGLYMPTEWGGLEQSASALPDGIPAQRATESPSGDGMWPRIQSILASCTSGNVSRIIPIGL